MYLDSFFPEDQIPKDDVLNP